MSNVCDLGFRLEIEATEKNGMVWLMGTWGDSALYSATASYLALA